MGGMFEHPVRCQSSSKNWWKGPMASGVLEQITYIFSQQYILPIRASGILWVCVWYNCYMLTSALQPIAAHWELQELLLELNPNSSIGYIWLKIWKDLPYMLKPCGQRRQAVVSNIKVESNELRNITLIPCLNSATNVNTWNEKMSLKA